MMKRKIITIDEDLCNGCGNCVTGCSEGALQIINGKAKLVREDFCDGFGDCIGTCPTGALRIVEREAPGFDPEAVKEHLLATQGENRAKKTAGVHEHDDGSYHHDMEQVTFSGGCPGSQIRTIERKGSPKLNQESTAIPGQVIHSELGQWPVQLHLVSPHAPYFQDRELVVMSTCAPLASADIHWRYLRDRSVVVGCPKLDRTDPYVNKLADIFQHARTPKVIIVRMEVPCCGGLTMIVEDAIKISGRDDMIVEEHVMAIDGKLKEIRILMPEGNKTIPMVR